ncbi:MAG: transposase, partial [Bdellovibrionota bacterium]
YKRMRQQKAQLGLFESANYRFDCLATNDLNINPRAAFEFYNGRANIENNIRELKNDYALGKIVTESFNANDVITQVTLLAYLLMQHFKRTLQPKEMFKMRLSTLRWQVLNIPGTMYREARRRWIRLQNVFVSEAFYSWIYQKLSRIKSRVVTPPEVPITN